MRIRVPSPDEQRPGEVDVAGLVSAEDFFRHVLCHRMFFAPVVARGGRGPNGWCGRSGGGGGAGGRRVDLAKAVGNVPERFGSRWV
jgi:hypothetical protein